MILSMKLISLSFDLESQSPKQPPPILHYLGYTLQVGTVIFGPWISYADYLASVTETNVKILVILTLDVAMIMKAVMTVLIVARPI